MGGGGRGVGSNEMERTVRAPESAYGSSRGKKMKARRPVEEPHGQVTVRIRGECGESLSLREVSKGEKEKKGHSKVLDLNVFR